jgi:hypothetical protein
MCDYTVDYRVIGDPAPNCRKTYTASYWCGDGVLRYVNLPAEATGSAAQLSCPNAPVVLVDTNGRTATSFTVSASGPIGHRGDSFDTFLLPAGLVRDQITWSLSTSGLSAGGTADWETDNPYDATIHVHAWADAFSSATIHFGPVTGQLPE